MVQGLGLWGVMVYRLGLRGMAVKGLGCMGYWFRAWGSVGIGKVGKPFILRVRSTSPNIKHSLKETPHMCV